MTKVYVVLGSQGEYSDRVTWVSGVFTQGPLAQECIRSRDAIRRIHDQWLKRYDAALRRDPTYYKTDIKEGEREAAEARAKELAGPEPECHLDRWINRPPPDVWLPNDPDVAP